METRPREAPGPAGPPPPPPPPASGPSPAVPALVFAGSSERDVALAKTFWNSVTLQPPLESRLAPRRCSLLSDGGAPVLGSGGGSRRASDAGKHDVSASPSFDIKEEERNQGIIKAEKNDVKEQYLKKATKREEIIALLKKQREERITKESSANLNRSTKMQKSKEQTAASDLEDQEQVKALN